MDAWSASQGNHASWGAFQIAGVAAFVGRTDVVAQQVERLLLKLPQQIDANGSQPLEEERADSWHYCNYNLQALVQLATLTQNWVNWLSYNQSQSAVSASNSTPPSTLPDLFQCVSSTGGSSSILGGINALLPYVARQGGVDVNLWRATHLQRAAIDANDIVINLQFLSATYDHPLYQRPADRGAPVERFGAGLNYSYDYNAVAEAIQPTVLSSAADLAWVRRVPATWLKSAAEIRTVMDALVNATAAADAWSGSSSTAGAAPSPLVKLARASSTGRAGGLESDLANASPPIHPPTSSILLATLLALVSIVLALQHAF
jgi:hypothetical protein